MLNEGMCLGAAEGASLLRRGSSRSGRPPKIILAGFGFSLGQLASGRWGAILSPHNLLAVWEPPHRLAIYILWLLLRVYILIKNTGGQ